MTSGDGMLVRLRFVGGILSPTLAHAVARLAERYGNGLIDLSSRANLQLRGVAEESLPALTRALDELGLLDSAPEAEAIRNIVASPLAGIDPAARLDIRPMVEALDRHLRSESGLWGLPGKFCFLIDDGGDGMPLDPASADIAFVAEEAERFRIFLGGSPAGTCRPDEVVRRAAELARGCIADGVRHRGRRDGRPYPASVGLRRLGPFSCLGVGAPFGRLAAADLAFLANIAEASRGELRLTCWRSILIVGHAVPETLAGSDLILDENHPLRAVAACPGAPACGSAHVDTRKVGTALAEAARGLGAGVTLHVSGCAKGCARPLPTAVTLVGTADGYDLVLDGRAGDIPVRRNIPAAELETFFDQGAQ